MLRTSLAIALVTTALAAPVFAQPAASTPADADLARARDFMREANELYKSGRVPESYGRYMQAWRAAKTFDIACNLGRTASELSLHRDAAEFLDYCLRHYPASSRPEAVQVEQRARQNFEEVKKKVATLTLRVMPAGSEVIVDGVRIGRAPLEGPLFLEAARHRIEARNPGFATAVVEIEGLAGQSAETALELKAEASGAAAPVPGEPTGANPADTGSSASDPGPASQHPKVVFVGAGATVALIGLGLGIGFTVDSESKASEKQDRIEKLNGPSACAGNPTGALRTECAEINELNAGQATSRALGVAGFVVFGVATAATLTYFLWPRARGSTADAGNAFARTRKSRPPLVIDDVAANLSHEGATLALSGRF